MTAKWETALKQIGQEQRTPNNFLGQIQNFVQKLITEVPNQLSQSTTVQKQIKQQQAQETAQQQAANLGTCPVCLQGNIVDKGKFYGCTAYKTEQACQFTLPKKWSGKTLTKSVISSLLTKGETAKIKGFKSKKTRKNLMPALN